MQLPPAEGFGRAVALSGRYCSPFTLLNCVWFKRLLEEARACYIASPGWAEVTVASLPLVSLWGGCLTI